ncbi:MAG: hypothetical protein SWO11_08215 [Thermodesulfobacteriota bacterium]|nr:hypothetical protein [Thermodesulfobacteriota bacterium]
MVAHFFVYIFMHSLRIGKEMVVKQEKASGFDLISRKGNREKTNMRSIESQGKVYLVNKKFSKSNGFFFKKEIRLWLSGSNYAKESSLLNNTVLTHDHSARREFFHGRTDGCWSNGLSVQRLCTTSNPLDEVHAVLPRCVGVAVTSMKQLNKEDRIKLLSCKLGNR